MMAFVAFALISMAWGNGPTDRGLYLAEKIAKILIFVLILIRCVPDIRSVWLVIWAWLIGVMYLTYQAWGHVGIHAGGRLVGGLGGPDFAESSDLAVHLVATLPMIAAAFFLTRRLWVRGVLVFLAALTINTIIMTRTRNAIVGLVAMALVAAFTLPRAYRFRGWLAIAGGVALCVMLADPGWWDRMQTISTEPHDASASLRFTYWSAAVEMASDHPLGIGLGNFHQTVMAYVPGLEVVRSAHSTFFECLAELGYPGLVMLLAMLGVAFWRLNCVRLEAARSEHTLEWPDDGERMQVAWCAFALQASMAGYLGCALFTTRLWAEDFWILLGLICGLLNAAAAARGVTSRRTAGDCATLQEPDGALFPVGGAT